MTFRLLCISAAIAALQAVAPSSRALVLDWGSVMWPNPPGDPNPDPLDNTYDVAPSQAGSERIQVTGSTEAFASGSPAINANLEGGQGTNNLSLNFELDFGRDDQSITVVVTFENYPLGVEGVSFALFDIDRDADSISIDQIRSISATAVDGVTAIAPTISNVGSAVTLSGSGFTYTLTGNSVAPDTGTGSNAGNATISFGSHTAIRSFTFTFGVDPTSARNPPPPSNIAMGDITFSPVPEVNPMPGVAGVLVASLWWIRRRRSAPVRSELGRIPRAAGSGHKCC